MEYGLVLVRGCPSSGKTTVMRLLNNKLVADGASTYFDRMGATISHIGGGWDGYLKQEAGVPGRKWPGYCAWLLLDEA